MEFQPIDLVRYVANVALKALAELESSDQRQSLIKSIEDKLVNFRALSVDEDHYYALLPLPTDFNELCRMLKQAMLVLMTLKVQHSKGKLSDEKLEGECQQLDILIIRLKAEIYKSQSQVNIERKKYAPAQMLAEKAIELLNSVFCDNEDVMIEVISAIERISEVNSQISEAIEEQNNSFVSKFQKEADEEEDIDSIDKMDIVFGLKRKF